MPTKSLRRKSSNAEVIGFVSELDICNFRALAWGVGLVAKWHTRLRRLVWLVPLPSEVLFFHKTLRQPLTHRPFSAYACCVDAVSS